MLSYSDGNDSFGQSNKMAKQNFKKLYTVCIYVFPNQATKHMNSHFLSQCVHFCQY